MHQPGQRGRRREQRHAHVVAEDLALGAHGCDVSQDARPQQNAVEEGAVGGFGDEVCGGGVVEGEGFGGEGGASGAFEVVRGDYGGERGFGIGYW